MNDIYRRIIDNPQLNPNQIIKDSDVFENINIINHYMNKTSFYDKQAIDNVTVKYFNKHYNWWLNMAKKVVNNYTNKVGKILVKARKDLFGENRLISISENLQKPITFNLKNIKP